MMIFTSIETLYCFVSNLFLYPCIRGQQVVQLTRVKSILSSLLLISTFISNCLVFGIQLPSAFKSLAFFGFFLDPAKVFFTFTVTIATIFLNYRCFHQIAYDTLALNSIMNDKKLYRVIIILTQSFSWFVFETILNFYVWKISGYHITDFIFYVFKNTASFYSYFILQMFLHHVKFLQYIFHHINSSLLSIPHGRKLRNVSLSKSYKFTIDRIGHLSSFHNSLCDFAGKINSAFSTHVLAVVAEVFLTVTFYLFYTAFV